MAHSEICPVCGGSGKITKDDNTTAGRREVKCHGCNGNGWITVGIDYPPPHYPPTYPIYPVNPYVPYTPWEPYKITWRVRI